jgi:phenylacetic acid degradation operon negative regulatory protein
VQPTAKSLILDLLSTLRGGAMPVRALVAAAGLFGIAENGVRVELARLTARGLVTRDQRGQYRLAEAAAAVQGRVASWGRTEERIVDWDGGWIAAHTGGLPRVRRGAQRSRTRALDFLGFRELAPALWVRPRNLRGGVAEVRRQLQALGLEPAARVFALDDLDGPTEAHARTLWDVPAMVAAYRTTRRALEESERHVRRLPVEQAMVETFLLGGNAIRQLALDPVLPEPIVPAAERGALARALVQYDRVGRQCWSAFMRGYRAPYKRSPVNLRVVSAVGELPAAGSATS